MTFILILGSTFLVFTWAILWRNSSLLIPTHWHGPRGKRCVALTFDDGPDPRLTPVVLDVLGRKNVKAAFFCTGTAARRHPEIMRRIHEEGHLIANHSHEHDWRMNFWHPTRVACSIVRCGRILARTTGRIPRLYRGPVGIKSPAQALIGWKLGLEFIGWARSGGDGGKTPLRPEALGRIARQSRPGDVILLHDGKPGRPDHEPCVRISAETYKLHLAEAIDRLRERGMEPIRLDELLGIGGSIAPQARQSRKNLFVQGWGANLRKLGAVLTREHASPMKLALAVALGVSIGSTPMFGLHALIGLIASIKLRMNKLAVFLGTNITNPLTGPLVILANIEAGCRIWTGKWLAISAATFRNHSVFSLGDRMLLYWIIGLPLATTVLAAATVTICYPLFLFLGARKGDSG